MGHDGDSSGRRRYLDWLRGVGVVIMVAAHTLDSWTQLDERGSPEYRWTMVIAGFGAPIFLFLAGVTLALAANARTRRGMTESEASRRALRRAWQVFGLAFLFRLQSIVISGGGFRAFLKVDILNIMGLSMVLSALLWHFGRSTRGRVLLLAGATAAVALLTPPVRTTPLLDWLPDPLEAYLRPQAGGSSFTLLPWGGFLFAGGVAGVWLDSGARVLEGRRVVWLAVVGVVAATTGFCLSYLPPVYQQTSFWTSSPTFFLVRLGVIAAAVGVAFWWAGASRSRWSPVEQLGVASLFIYWVHVEMVYGVLSTPLHRALTFTQAIAAMTVFLGLLFGLVRAKNRWTRPRRVEEKSTKFESFRASGAPDRTHSS